MTKVIKSGCIQDQNLLRRIVASNSSLQNNYDTGEMKPMSKIKDDLFSKPREKQENIAAICCT